MAEALAWARYAKRDGRFFSSATFADEYTNVWAMQLPQQELAHSAKTRALHVNSALYELGHKGE